MGTYQNVDPTYAVHKVTEIDAQLKLIDERKKALTEKRRQLAPFLPKKSDD